MQTPQEQQQTNLIRLAVYRAKQTKDQLCRARVAEQVNSYCKKLGLNLIQSAAAIRIAAKQIEHGCSETEAYNAGAKAAHTIALVSANERIRHKRSFIRLH